MNLISEDRDPALITILEYKSTFCIRWLFRSATYKFPSEPNKVEIGVFNWFILFPLPFPPATTSPELFPGINFIILSFSESVINITPSELNSTPLGYLNSLNPVP